MSMTRRRFTIVAAASGVSLTVLGCGGDDGGDENSQSGAGGTGTGPDKAVKKKPKLATEPFLIGTPERYRGAGVYPDYRDDKGVWIVSDGQSLVALNALCTHLACMTELDMPSQQFSCPCHESRFDFQGVNQAGSKAKRPLERCAVRLMANGSMQQIEVDPTRRFRKDKDQWSDPASMFRF